MKKFLPTLLLLTASAFFSFPATTHADTTTGLVGHWTLDGRDTNWTTGQTLDRSGQSNTGQLIAMSTSTSPVSGKIGQALKFNGSTSYTSLPYNFGAPNVFTASLWFKTTVAGQALIGQVDSTAPPGVPAAWVPIFVIHSDGKLRAEIWNGVNGATTTTSAAMNDGRWHHAVITASSTAQSFYVDGVYIGSRGGTADQSWWVKTYIGLGYYDTGRGAAVSGWSYFNGSLDDVRFYSRAFTATDVMQLYKQGAAKLGVTPTNTLTQGLVGHWTFDGKDTNWGANTTADRSGKGNTGSLVGMNLATSTLGGKMGQALTAGVSKSSYIAVSSPSAEMNIAYPITMAAWYKTTDPNGAAVGWNVLMRRDTATGGTRYLWGINFGGSGQPGKVAIEAYSQSTTDYSALDTARTDDGGWHHVVGIIDGSQLLTLYVDGVSKASSQGSGLGVPASQFWIFQDPPTSPGGASTGAHFIGAMDDVRIYNRALSVSEITQLYKQGAAKLGVTPAAPAAGGLSAGLAGHWTMDGKHTNWATGQMTDASGQGNTGQLIALSTSTAPVSGKLGQAFTLNGTSQYVNLGNPANTQITSGTVSAWIKTPNAGSSYRGILVKQGNYGLFLKDNVLDLWDWGAAADRSTGVNLADNKWHHVAATFQSGVGSGTTVYIDGASSLATTITTADNSCKIEIGAGSESGGSGGCAGGPAQFFTGTIDDARVYNRVLSASEIKQLYKQGSATSR